LFGIANYSKKSSTFEVPKKRGEETHQVAKSKAMEQTVYHIPALLAESMDGLGVKSDGIYVDATFGGGGHSRAILERLGPDGRLIGMDQDIDAWNNRMDDDRFTFAHGNFAYLRNFVRYYGYDKIDGILADLGVSFHHFDAVERGFTFRADAPLDMRMNRSAVFTARDLLATYSEERLADILYLYGELRQSRRLAAALVKARPLTTTGDLVNAVRPLLKPSQEKKELSMVFQALRIEVNGELEALRKLLLQSLEVLKPGGRLAIITYHSLEDRLVKNFMRTGNVEGRQEKDFYGRVNTPWRVVTKVIVPDAAEVERNPRSRSAKLRVAEFVGQAAGE
jgi:16S rRNA (cytosine1402-N4)-methyltransferase